MHVVHVVSRGDVEKRAALENLDLILLCIDEVVDGGYVFLNHVIIT